MAFRNSRRLVVIVLLVASLMRAQLPAVPPDSSSVAAVQSTSNCCSLGRLESRLTKVDRQLSDIQRAIVSLKDPLINEYCTVDLASYGFDDSPIHGYVKTNGGSSEETYTPAKIDKYRGITLFELDPTACVTRNRERFDTYASKEDIVQLLETMEAATKGTIIVGVTADTPEHYAHVTFQTLAGPLFTRYNMNITGLSVRDKFAFIMQKGHPKKTVFQRKVRHGASLRMKILLSGSTQSDVRFKPL